MPLTPEDSPSEDEHDWNTYLIETNSEAAPASNFRQSLDPPLNEFNIGDKLESIDPRNQDSWCIGTVIDKDGPRLRLRLDGTDDRNDFWRLVDSADIRPYGSTAKSGGQLVPPLGFQQNSSRWAKYFERNIKDGPFADPSYFKTVPAKPEKNLFKKGQKLEAVDPRHSHLICPATVHTVTSGDHRIIISLDGWSSSNNFKIDYASRDIFPVGWCKSAGIRLTKVGGYPYARTPSKTLLTTSNKQNGNVRQQQQSKNKKSVISPSSNRSSESSLAKNEKNNHPKTSINKKEQIQPINTRKTYPIVTVYWNYTGNNCGKLLNPEKFRSLIPSVFGPSECDLILKNIFDSCIQCSYQPTSFADRLVNLFPTSNNKKKNSIQIKLENGALISVPSIENADEFWDVIRRFENDISAGKDLFVSTRPPPSHSSTNQRNGSSSSFIGKKDDFSSITHSLKRKSPELNSDKTLLTNGKSLKTTLDEKSPHDTKPSLNNIKVQHPERMTPNEVATFIRGIDLSFDDLAKRFLQEEIDGKALVLLTTETLMKHMGLKLGPALKIVHHIEKLKP